MSKLRVVIAGPVSVEEDNSSTSSGGTAEIVQATLNFQPLGTPSSLATQFLSSQIEHSGNVVFIACNTANAVVTQVTDDAGNTYDSHGSFTDVPNNYSLFCYVAKDIAAHPAGNVVDVQFQDPVTFPSVRLIEVSPPTRGVIGVDVDMQASISPLVGQSSIKQNITTTKANGLLIAFMYDAGNTAAVGTEPGWLAAITNQTNDEADGGGDGSAIIWRIAPVAKDYNALVYLQGGSVVIIGVIALSTS